MAVDVEELIATLEDLSYFQRENIVEQLPKPTHELVEPLIGILNRNQGRQSWLAALALSHIEDHRSVPALIDALPKLSDAIQVMLIEILANLKDKRACNIFLDMLHKDSVVVQIAATRALVKMADLRCVPPLMETLAQTESASLRYTIIEALGNLGDTQAIELIKRYANDKDHHVRRRVEQALLKLSAVN